MSKDEIVLSDGLVLPPNCLFLNGHIFTWNTPIVKMLEAMPNGRGWEEWTDDIWSIFETVTPRPGKSYADCEIFLFLVLGPPCYLSLHVYVPA